MPLSWLKAGLESVHDLGVVGGEGGGPDQPLFLAAPVPHHDRAAGIRIRGLQDPHRLVHHDRPGAVVGGAGRPVPRVEVRAQDDVFVGELRARDRRHHVEGGDVPQELGVRVEADAGALVAGRQPVHQRVVLAGKVDRGYLAG